MSQVKATANAQAPLAAILGCMDSRVPPELVFDQRIGDIFSVRVAGNIVNTDILGSCRRRRRSHVEEQEVRTERGRPECKGRGRGAKLTAHSDGLAALVKDHKLKIVSAMHDVSTGAVKCSPEDICDVTRSAPAAAI
jgi:carbonic anhydrase